MKKENIIDIITDEDGRKIVVITDIRFKGKRNIDWEDVENYLKEYVGKCYEVVETADQVFIGNDFPAELKGSEDTKRLCGANAKTKANATQKRFALPVYSSDLKEVERFNIYRIEMLIRHAADGNLYLYDMVNIKKETSTPLRQ